MCYLIHKVCISVSRGCTAWNGSVLGKLRSSVSFIFSVLSGSTQFRDSLSLQCKSFLCVMNVFLLMYWVQPHILRFQSYINKNLIASVCSCTHFYARFSQFVTLPQRHQALWMLLISSEAPNCILRKRLALTTHHLSIYVILLWLSLWSLVVNIGWPGNFALGFFVCFCCNFWSVKDFVPKRNILTNTKLISTNYGKFMTPRGWFMIQASPFLLKLCSVITRRVAWKPTHFKKCTSYFEGKWVVGSVGCNSFLD